MNNIIAAVFFLLLTPLSRAAEGNEALLEARFLELRADKARIYSRKPVSTPKEFIAELRTAQKYYGEYVPDGLKKANGLETKETWEDMEKWYKITSQGDLLMGKLALVLGKACGTMGPELSVAKGEAEKTLAAARKTLKFLKETPWVETLKKPILVDEPGGQRSLLILHTKDVKDWERVVRCVSGGKPGPEAALPPPPKPRLDPADNW